MHGLKTPKEMNFLDRYSKNSELLNIIRFLPVGGKLLQTDGRIYITTLIVVLRNFANVPKKEMSKFN